MVDGDGEFRTVSPSIRPAAGLEQKPRRSGPPARSEDPNLEFLLGELFVLAASPKCLVHDCRQEPLRIFAVRCGSSISGWPVEQVVQSCCSNDAPGVKYFNFTWENFPRNPGGKCFKTSFPHDTFPPDSLIGISRSSPIMATRLGQTVQLEKVGRNLRNAAIAALPTAYDWFITMSVSGYVVSTGLNGEYGVSPFRPICSR